MDGLAPVCDWDERARLLILRFPTLSDRALAAALWTEESGDPASAKSGRWTFLRDLAPGLREAVFRAPRDATAFDLALFTITAADAPLAAPTSVFDVGVDDFEGPRGAADAAAATSGAPAVPASITWTNAENAAPATGSFADDAAEAPVLAVAGDIDWTSPWRRFRFDGRLSVDRGDADASLRLRTFSVPRDAAARDPLAQHEGPMITRAATTTLPGGAGPRAAADQAARRTRGPCAVSVSTARDGARGPVIRAHPSETVAFDARFSWVEEEIVDPETLLTPGFDVSHAPMVEIELPASDAPEPASEAAPSQRGLADLLADAFVFFHAPFGPNGYETVRAAARAAPEDEIDADDARRVFLRHAWLEANHRDVIGVAFRGAPRLTASGPLAGAQPHSRPDGVQCIAALYLGETLYSIPNGAEKFPHPVADANDRDGGVDALRTAIQSLLDAAAAEAIAPAEHSWRLTTGVDWAWLAAQLGLTELDFSGANEVAPETLAAAVRSRAQLRTTTTAEAAAAALGVAVDTLSAFREQGDVLDLLGADPTVCETVARGAVGPLQERSADHPMVDRMLEALSGPDTAAWWRGLSLGAQRAAWRLAANGGDLDQLRKAGVSIDDPASQALCDDPDRVDETLRATPGDVSVAHAILSEAPEAARREDGPSSDDPTAATIGAVALERRRDPTAKTLADQWQAARRVAAARTAFRRDLAELEAMCVDERLPAPPPLDALWAQAKRRIAEADVDATHAEIWARAGADDLVAAAAAAGVPDRGEVLARLSTAAARWCATAHLAAIADVADIAADLYDALANALSPAVGQASIGSPPRRRPPALEPSPARRDGPLSDYETELRAEDQTMRRRVMLEIEQLRRLAWRGGAARSAPVWRAQSARADSEAAVAESLRCCDVARALASGLEAPPTADGSVDGAADAHAQAHVVAATRRAALADIDAVMRGCDWIAARVVWRRYCTAISNAARDPHGRAREAGALARRLSEPPERWPDIVDEIEHLLATQPTDYTESPPRPRGIRDLLRGDPGAPVGDPDA